MNALLPSFLAFGAPSTTELVLIFLVILLLFGARKLPELAKGIGQAMREFKKATREAEDSIRTAMDEKPEKPKAKDEPVQTRDSKPDEKQDL